MFAPLETKLLISIFHDEASDLERRILEKGAGRKFAEMQGKEGGKTKPCDFLLSSYTASTLHFSSLLLFIYVKKNYLNN